MTAEETRALAYRQAARQRAAAERARAAALRGSSAARAALLDRWKPLILWLRERQNDGQEAG